MPSTAYTDHLLVLLKDAEELGDAHKKLRTGKVGRQWGLGALNRAVVVISVSAWEAYVEAVVKEAVEALKPTVPQLGAWPTLKAQVQSKVARFNNPNTEQVRGLFEEIGLLDVTSAWHWNSVDVVRARQRLAEALKSRHEIAHGVNPRPTIHNKDANKLPGFFRRLGECTDRAVKQHLVQELGIVAPWH
jgi:hypothetical protein